MKRPRRTFGASLAVLLVACIMIVGAVAGCGSSGSSSGGSEVVIGVDASMSGPLAGFGAYEKWAVEAAVADQNAKGGITVDGKQVKVKIVLLDDKSDPNVASTNVDTLINKNGAIAIIGPVVPTVGNAAALAAEKNGIPYLMTGNPLEPFRAVKEWKYAFNFFFAAPTMVANLIKFPADLALKTNMKIAISVDNSPDGPVFGPATAKEAQANGWDVVLEETHPAAQTEFGGLINKLKASGADYVVVLGDTPSLVALRKQMDAANYKPKLLYFQRGAQLQQFADSLGPLANGVTLEAYWLPEMPYPGAADLAKRYETATGNTSGQILGPEYAAGQIMMAAITRADSTDPQKVVDAITATDATFDCGPVKFAADHTAELGLVVAQWQDAKSVQVWPEGDAATPVLFPMP